MKRLVGLFLCLCMVLTIGAPAFAAESDAEAMKTALLTVKNRIEIPNSYAQFEYSSGEHDGEVTWNFYWSDSDGNGISVWADHAGRILRYECYNTKSSDALPPQMTKAEGVSVAKKLLSKTHPEIADKLVFDSAATYRYSDAYAFTFVREEYGIRVPSQTVLVELNYRTLACTRINAGSIVYDAEIKAPGTLVTKELIFSQWENMANLTLEYEIDDTGVGNLWYNVKGEIRPIDAESGELLSEDMIWEKAESEDSMTAGGATNEIFRDQLTKEEEEKNQELAGLISKQKADSIVRSYTALALGKSDSLYSAQLYRDTYAYGTKAEQRSYWRLEYSGPVTKGESPNQAYACIDAKSGVLLAFRAYGKNHSSGKIGEASAHSSAKAMLESAAPDAVGKTDDGVRDELEVSGTPAEYRFRFGRVEQNIPVSNNQITISVSSASGKVIEYNRNWTETAIFQDPSRVISLEDAKKILIGYQEPKLEYYTQTVYLYDVESDSKTVAWYYSGIPTKKKITLVYSGPKSLSRIAAESGEVAGWDTTEREEIGTYTDIKGHFAEREIQLLLDIGILPTGEKFEPNRQVTQQELLYFLFAAQPQYRTYDMNDKNSVEELYKTAIAQGILTESERAPTKCVTRTEAARMMVRCTEHATIAKNPNIFRCDYRDAASIPKNDLGYVVVAKALGIMQGSGGMFRPLHGMTRGEAICMIFKYLTVKG